MERRKLVALILVIAVSSVSVFSVLLYSGYFDSERKHDPIIITSDEEFTEENGVTTGSGTEKDPYIIEGWRIDSSGIEYGLEAAGILIKETLAHFVVRNVSLEGLNIAGILLKNVSNGRVENSMIIGHYEGIGVHDSIRCSIIRNRVTSCFTGMSISNIDSVLIEENSFDNGSVEYLPSISMKIGIRIIGSDFANVTISGNRFEGSGLEFDEYEIPIGPNSSGLNIPLDNTVNGRPLYFFENHSQFRLYSEQVGQLILLNCNNASISGLEISSVSTCIYLMKVRDCEIVECALSNAVFTGGIIARESTRVTIESSMIENARVFIHGCTNVAIKHNQITSCIDGVNVDDSANVTIMENSICDCASGLMTDGERIVINGNTLRDNGAGIMALGGNITVTGNTLRGNGYGIMASMGSATDRLEVFLNDFIDNADSADCSAYLYTSSFSNETIGRGNYWSDYEGLDEDEDGIGDTPYLIAWRVQDDYPLMTPANS